MNAFANCSFCWLDERQVPVISNVTFCSGYDFGYLLKLLTNNNLPTDETSFFELLRLFFPSLYDVKYLMKSCKNLKVSRCFHLLITDFRFVSRTKFAPPSLNLRCCD